LVDVDKLDEPCVFTFDIPVRILGRDSRRSSGFTITSLFGGGSRAYSALTRIYTLDLEPPSARSADDLWRLDTSRKYVKGEEVLGLEPSGEGSTAMGWRVRGVSLIEDFAKARKAQRALGEVQVTKAVLEIMSAGEALNGDHKDGVEEAPERGGSGDRELVGKCVDLWKKQLDYRFIVSNPCLFFGSCADTGICPVRLVPPIGRGGDNCQTAQKALTRSRAKARPHRETRGQNVSWHDQQDFGSS
jgi:kinesin family protein 1